MEIQNSEQLSAAKCTPCSGGDEPCSLDFSQQQLNELEGWELTSDNQRICKHWTVRNFMEGIDFFTKVVDYRNVAIEIWTHDIGGLSENDFILAAKINQIEI